MDKSGKNTQAQGQDPGGLDQKSDPKGHNWRKGHYRKTKESCIIDGETGEPLLLEVTGDSTKISPMPEEKRAESERLRKKIKGMGYDPCHLDRNL